MPLRSPLLLAVFGDPVAHSLSPAMHGAALRALKLRGAYLKFRVARHDLRAALAGAAALGFRGVNLTIPLKETALPLMDRLTREARRAGAVNTVTITRGRLEGHSTDGEGFLRSLVEAWSWRPRGARVVLLGAGGAARSVAFALADAGAARLTIVNRSVARGRRLARRVGALTRTPSRAAALPSAAGWSALLAHTDLLVNATPLGMHGGTSPVPADALRRPLRVCDLVYVPAVTPLLAAARRRGLVAVNGAGMLVHQGAMALERWTGRRAPVAVMRRALLAALGRPARTPS